MISKIGYVMTLLLQSMRTMGTQIRTGDFDVEKCLILKKMRNSVFGFLT